MFGPGEYVPDPTEGIVDANDLPLPLIVPYDRNHDHSPCPRCGHLAYRHRSICDSRWVSRPAHRCSRTGLESFPSPGSSAMRPLSWGPMRGLEPPSGLVTCGFAPPPCGASLPHAVAWVSRVSSVPPSDHLHITGPTSASPGHDPRRWLLRASSSPAASGWHLLRQVTGLPESRWGLRRSPSP